MVIVGIVLVIIGFGAFFIPINDSGMNVLQTDKFCQESSESLSPESEELEVCEDTKFFNSIYFLLGIGLVLIFWSGYMEKYSKRKNS